MRLARLVLLATLLLLGCAGATSRAAARPDARLILTGGPNQSMIYLLETTAGIVLIDLGWLGAEAELRAALVGVSNDPSDVTAVFLTHAHRDHIAAWPVVAGSTFHVGADEIDKLVGLADYEGWVPRTVDRLHPAPRPGRGELRIVGIERDTAFVIGADTIRAFPVPGHTGGSVAYLARGILFAGDALSHSLLGGMRHARSGYSDDAARARRSARDLLARLAPFDVEMICTAHARCEWYDDDLRRSLRN